MDEGKMEDFESTRQSTDGIIDPPPILIMNSRFADQIRCTNCSGRYCGRRNVRVAGGKPFAACNLKLAELDTKGFA